MRSLASWDRPASRGIDMNLSQFITCGEGQGEVRWRRERGSGHGGGGLIGGEKMQDL